jgi:phospholipase/carboxylesterase
MSIYLDAVRVEPPKTAEAAVIWFHGLGADGSDFVPMVPELNLPADHGVRFIFPNAPIRPVTLNQGMQMRAWFDIQGLKVEDKQDSKGIQESVQLAAQFINEQKTTGIPYEKIIVAGFSQGGAIALHIGLSFEHKLGGIIGLSTYLPLADALFDNKTTINKQIPIFMAHGTLDPLVPMWLGESSKNLLEEHNYPVAWHTYPMMHSVCENEIDDIGKWMRKVLFEE